MMILTLFLLFYDRSQHACVEFRRLAGVYLEPNVGRDMRLCTRRLLTYGQECLERGEVYRAKLAVKVGLEFHPRSVPGLVSRGSLVMLEAAGGPPFDTSPPMAIEDIAAPGGPVDRALADFNEALKWDGGNPTALEFLRLCMRWGATLHGKLGDWDRSLEVFGQCLAMEPDSEDIKYEIALVTEERDLERSQNEEVEDTSSVGATYSESGDSNWPSDSDESDEA